MSTALLSAFCDLDFLHSAEPSLGSLSPGVLDARAAGSRAGGAPGPRYKTELCRPFEESGACRYGDKCQFAHGGRELRLLARHPKYKTELCRTFHSAGLCPYGPRCHFIHNADERRPRPAPPE
ncbi:mRNA decay activator protein ZFP36L2-like, partial [Sorex fumeus]|uniref:mRNA decay activator protein ZFP36L2-like n=1 Tax=Sorex fumeus TaxID=62283 RepID=UPI0024ADDD5E